MLGPKEPVTFINQSELNWKYKGCKKTVLALYRYDHWIKKYWWLYEQLSYMLHY